MEALPIGAIVARDGEVISRGRAGHRKRQSQLMHAERQALLSGGEPLWTRYDDAVLFTTCEPCPVCLGAAVMADIPHIVFASHDAIIHSSVTIEANPYVRRHIRTYLGGVLEAEARAIIDRYDPVMLTYIVNGP